MTDVALSWIALGLASFGLYGAINIVIASLKK